MHGGTAADGLLYRDLDPREAGEIVEQLTKAHVPYRLEDQGGAIFVPQGQVAAARLLLARNGLPSGGSVGYEIFDKGNNFTATQFEQTINETRAMEGELERSIRLIHGVRGARVHLVLRHRELFATQEQGAQASILLSMDGARRLDDESVNAVVNLVSSAVPGLETRNISLIDNRGHVLLKQGAGSTQGGDTPDAQKQALEQRLSRGVEDMLGASLGMGHVRAETTVQMNSDHVHETQESYDPDEQVLRSQQTKSEKDSNTQPSANTSVGNNLPNAGAAQTSTGTQTARQEQTNNYEIGRKVRTLVQDEPRLARLSVAVMVDGVMTKDSKGQPLWQPRSDEELKRLTALTKSAIGFDEARGDVVTVMSMQFAALDVSQPNEAVGGLARFMGRTGAMELARFGIFAICLVLVLFFVVRPLLRPAQNNLEAPTVLEASNARLKIPSSAEGVTPAALPTAPKLLEREEEMVAMDGVTGQIKASSIQRVSELVDSNPAESIALMRNWLLPQHEKA
ncbi:flagellar MS-ring protein [Neokomagataea thailandica NBRC 106555]|nr:flagellar MS-ring protein [Neokomagataea thailandica NBRC 106555]